ncbi:rhamnose ABC transporter membrane protein [Rhizobiales bacterium GAS113]|nr:rhamnose ABC transporter membrane protein [Rhizobiales bacterium GAS113]SEE32126.1 rhamnose ABC transporter membrane protein [Rhizobiales bacterium GAS188]
MKAFLAYRELVLGCIVAAMVIGISVYAPAFGQRDSLIGVLNDTSFLFMMAVAQMIVILTRGIDLSVAANLALTGMLTAMVAQSHHGLPPAAFAMLAIGIGAGLGLLNGSLIAFLGIPPIVVTLGTLAIFRGMIVVIGGGSQVNAADMGDNFQLLPKLTVLGLSSVFWIAAALSLAAWLFLSMTRPGRGLYAVGGNPIAARYCGIDPGRQQLLAYAISGAVAGLSGYLWVARYGVAYVEIATGYELTVIAACVIGGVSIGGGVGSVAGTLMGALFIGVIVNALPVMQVSPFWQMGISGAVILLAVVINARADLSRGKLILPKARREAARARG